jgi:hypothetical protein
MVSKSSEGHEKHVFFLHCNAMIFLVDIAKRKEKFRGDNNNKLLKCKLPEKAAREKSFMQ